jgi:hypothetical protein
MKQSIIGSSALQDNDLGQEQAELAVPLQSDDQSGDGGVPGDLKALMARWRDLDPGVRAAISALIKATAKKS